MYEPLTVKNMVDFVLLVLVLSFLLSIIKKNVKLRGEGIFFNYFKTEFRNYKNSDRETEGIKQLLGRAKHRAGRDETVLIKKSSGANKNGKQELAHFCI